MTILWYHMINYDLLTKNHSNFKMCVHVIRNGKLLVITSSKNGLKKVKPIKVLKNQKTKA